MGNMLLWGGIERVGTVMSMNGFKSIFASYLDPPTWGTTLLLHKVDTEPEEHCEVWVPVLLTAYTTMFHRK